MKEVLLIIGMMFSLPTLAEGGSPQVLSFQATEQEVEWLRGVIAEHMRDPDSVKLRGVTWLAKSGEFAPDHTFCGEVNAKNAYGGYTGFQPFYYWSALNSPLKIPDDSDGLQVLINVCTKPAGERSVEP